MYLSADALRDLMQRALAQEMGAGASEKRRAGRIITRSQVIIVHCGESTTANLADVSHRGLSLFVHSRMKRGDTFILRLRNQTAPAQILCTVVHCRPINSDLFKIGAEFTCTLPPEVVAAPAAASAAPANPAPTTGAAAEAHKVRSQSLRDELARIQQSILD